jgi:sigma-B regulation protein RsbU (phosphoserine phosphatase)
MAAGVGRPWNPAWQAVAHFDPAGSHPAAACLREDRLMVVRGSDQNLDRAIVEQFGLAGFVRVFLPLQAGGRRLGTLELGFAGHAPRISLAESSKGRLAAFADQVAVAVHNMQLLRRTEQALARKMEELTVGQEIQRSMLPRSVPDLPGWEFAAFYREARIVGGDFYDFYRLPGKPQRLGLVVADVADKGVPAALFMALSRTVIRSTALSGRGPASTLLRANELILEDSASDLFLSAVYGVLDVESGRLIYANAGHNRPLWVRASTGRVEELGARGIILGVVEEIELEEQRIDLAEGDVLLFYTDGITEAMNARGELFDDERLQAVLAGNHGTSAGDLLQAIIAAVDAFTAGAEQSDDVTCFVVKRSATVLEKHDG